MTIKGKKFFPYVQKYTYPEKKQEKLFSATKFPRIDGKFGVFLLYDQSINKGAIIHYVFLCWDILSPQTHTLQRTVNI